MRIGVIVEGDSEYQCLPSILNRVDTPHQISRVLRAKVDPLASPPIIVRCLRPEVLILANRGVDRIIVALDFERGEDCAGDRATEISAALSTEFGGVGVNDFQVVMKYTKFENWLVSDVQALRSLRKRFRFTDNQLNRLTNRADKVDALALLKGAAIGTPYGKVRDSAQIVSRAKPERMAANSRSFRRMLRVIGNPAYAGQSREP